MAAHGLGTILNTTESRVTDLSLGYMAFPLSLNTPNLGKPSSSDDNHTISNSMLLHPPSMPKEVDLIIITVKENSGS